MSENSNIIFVWHTRKKKIIQQIIVEKAEYLYNLFITNDDKNLLICCDQHKIRELNLKNIEGFDVREGHTDTIN